MENIFMQARVCEFEEKEVEPKKVKKIIAAGMAAPSAGNQQPWEFYVVTDKALLKKLAGCSRYAGPIEDAPLAIVPCKQKRVSHPNYVYQDMAACCENILVEAGVLGLGTDWIGIAPKEGRMEMVRNAMNLPANLDPFALIAVGYPKNGDIPAKPKRFDINKVHFYTEKHQMFS